MINEEDNKIKYRELWITKETRDKLYDILNKHRYEMVNDITMNSLENELNKLFREYDIIIKCIYNKESSAVVILARDHDGTRVILYCKE